MNTYTLDRYEGMNAILIETERVGNKLMVFKERLIEFAQPGDILAIDFDHLGNLRHVEIVRKQREHKNEPDLEGV
ncbi:hypothetical protein [Halobacillus sp. B23F22_1]|uniref:hypothetical protein n=1 Tax=Halobacillus sp. B23F22_1 TaxID=3459514 RepID=UPI00373F7D21